MFVVRGNTLYKMNPQSLRVEGQTALPDEPRARPLRDGVSPDGTDLRDLPPGTPPRPRIRRPGDAPAAPGAPPVPNR